MNPVRDNQNLKFMIYSNIKPNKRDDIKTVNYVFDLCRDYL